jgi:hypothetical protein
MLDLKSEESYKSKKDYKRILEQHKTELDQGGLKYLQSHFRPLAVNFGTYEEFEKSASAKLAEYRSFAGDDAYIEAKSSLRKVFLDSRSDYPLEFPISSVGIGQTREDFLKVVPKTPLRIVPLHIPSTPPKQYFVYEYKFTLPKNLNVPGNQPIWITFQDNKVDSFGYGNARHSEYEKYQKYLNEDVNAGRVKESSAQRILYDKYIETHGEPDPIMRESVLYTILVTEKLETGEITRSEADYMLAKNDAEIQARIEQINLQKAAAERQERRYRLEQRRMISQQNAQAEAAELARRQMRNQAFMGVLYLNQLNQMNQSLQGIQQNTMPIGNEHILMPY